MAELPFERSTMSGRALAILVSVFAGSCGNARPVGFSTSIDSGARDAVPDLIDEARTSGVGGATGQGVGGATGQGVGGATGQNDAGSVAGNLVAITPDITGYVDVTASGTTGIKGVWYAYADGIGADGTTATGDCELKGMHAVSDCSSITSPTFGSFPNIAGKMCTTATAAKIINLVSTVTPDYNNIWGAGIALDLNNNGGVAAGAIRLPYNASANGVIGMAFDIDVVPLAGLRVEFPTKTAANAAFWGGDQPLSPVKPGHNEILWTKVTGPFYDVVAPPFDPTTILSIQFHVPTSTTASATYNFCISNLSAILQ